MPQIVNHGLHAVIVAVCLIVIFVYNTMYIKNYSIEEIHSKQLHILFSLQCDITSQEITESNCCMYIRRKSMRVEAWI